MFHRVLLLKYFAARNDWGDSSLPWLLCISISITDIGENLEKFFQVFGILDYGKLFREFLIIPEVNKIDME